MKPSWQMFLCSLASGFFGGLFCFICFPVSLLSGAIAVGLYLRIKPEIYITPGQATVIGAMAGFFTVVFSTAFTWFLFAKIMGMYRALIGQRAASLLQTELEVYGQQGLSLFIINLGLAFLFGVLGGWMSLLLVYQDHRIPKDL